MHILYVFLAITVFFLPTAKASPQVAETKGNGDLTYSECQNTTLPIGSDNFFHQTLKTLYSTDQAPQQSFLFDNGHKCLRSLSQEGLIFLKVGECEQDSSGLEFKEVKSPTGTQFIHEGKCLSRNAQGYAILEKCNGSPSQHFEAVFDKNQRVYKILFRDPAGKSQCMDFSHHFDDLLYFYECDSGKKFQNIHLSFRTAMSKYFDGIDEKESHVLSNLKDGSKMVFAHDKGKVAHGIFEKEEGVESSFSIVGTKEEFSIRTRQPDACLSVSNDDQVHFDPCDDGKLEQTFRMVPVRHHGTEILAVQSFYSDKCLIIDSGKVVARDCESQTEDYSFLSFDPRFRSQVHVQPKLTEINNTYRLDKRNDNLEIPRFSLTQQDDPYTLVNDYFKSCLKSTSKLGRLVFDTCSEDDEKLYLIGREGNFAIKNEAGKCLTSQSRQNNTKVLGFLSCNGSSSQSFALKREVFSYSHFKLNIVNQGLCLDLHSTGTSKTNRELNLTPCQAHLQGQRFHFYNSIVEMKITEKLPSVPSEAEIKKQIDEESKTEKNTIVKRPNIIFIFMDTLRFDHLNQKLAPNITQFTQSSKAFKGLGGATSTHHSLFTMMYSKDAFYTEPYEEKKWSLGSPALYYMKKNGYKVNVFGNKEWYFDTGKSNEQVSGSYNYKFNKMLFGENSFLVDRGLAPFEKEERAQMGDLNHGCLDQKVLKNFQSDVASRLGHLKKDGGEIFFLMFSGCHEKYAPYIAPEKEGQYNPNAYKYDPNVNVHLISDEATRRQVRDLYENTVIGFDSQFKNLVSFLKKEGLYDDAIIVFFSDHGEGLFEKEEYSHGGTALTPKSDVPVALKFPVGHSTTLPDNKELHFSLKDLWPTIIKNIVPDYSHTVAAQVLSGNPIEDEDLSKQECNIISRANGLLGVFEFTAVSSKYKAILQFGTKDIAGDSKIGKQIESGTLHVISILDSNDNQLILSQEEKRKFFQENFQNCVEKNLRIKLSSKLTHNVNEVQT